LTSRAVREPDSRQNSIWLRDTISHSLGYLHMRAPPLVARGLKHGITSRTRRPSGARKPDPKPRFPLSPIRISLCADGRLVLQPGPTRGRRPTVARRCIRPFVALASREIAARAGA
jgi:hypothetical protein